MIIPQNMHKSNVTLGEIHVAVSNLFRNIAYILSIDINGGVTFMNDCNLMYLMVKSTVEI